VWDDTNRATFLLSAFAMENMVKAFLVYEYPKYVAHGRLSVIGSHDLPALVDKSLLIPYKVRDRWVFEALATGNQSWMRYPCGRDADNVEMEQDFSIKLWLKYCSLMESYTCKMKKLLSRGWLGPYGKFVQWSFGGHF